MKVSVFFSIFLLAVSSCCCWVDPRVPLTLHVISKSCAFDRRFFRFTESKTRTNLRLLPFMSNGKNEDEEIFHILSTAKVIAVVGATNRQSMPVYGVMEYLQNAVHLFFCNARRFFWVLLIKLFEIRDIGAYLSTRRLRPGEKVS